MILFHDLVNVYGIQPQLCIDIFCVLTHSMGSYEDMALYFAQS